MVDFYGMVEIHVSIFQIFNDVCNCLYNNQFWRLKVSWWFFQSFSSNSREFLSCVRKGKKKRNKRITHLPPKIWPNSYTFFFTLLWVDLNQKVVTALNSSADLNLPIRDKSLHLKFEITITSRCQCQLNHLYLISDIAEIKLSLSLNYKRTYIVELFSNQKHLCMGKHWY